MTRFVVSPSSVVHGELRACSGSARATHRYKSLFGTTFRAVSCVYTPPWIGDDFTALMHSPPHPTLGPLPFHLRTHNGH